MPLIHRAVAKCLTINQGTQTEMDGGGEVCGGAEKLAVPPGRTVCPECGSTDTAHWSPGVL